MSELFTVEQMRDFLNRHSIFDDISWTHGTQELVFDEDKLQAMAEELNAKLNTITESSRRELSFWRAECNEWKRTAEYYRKERDRIREEYE